MRRISRKKAWSILSSHSIVVLGHGGATVKETKGIIGNTLENSPNILNEMMSRSIYSVEHDKGELHWSDGNSMNFNFLLEAFLDGEFLYFREYYEKHPVTTAVYVMDLEEIKDVTELNNGNIIQLLIDIMDIIDEPENIMELNKYIEDRGMEEVLNKLVRAYCIDYYES